MRVANLMRLGGCSGLPGYGNLSCGVVARCQRRVRVVRPEKER